MPVISNKKFTADELKQIRKSVAVKVLFEPNIYAKAKEKFKDLGLRGRSHFFDYLVVNGVAYLNHDICNLVIERAKPMREAFRQKCTDRLNGKNKKETGDYKQIIFWMYPRDFDSLNRFSIQKNIYKMWIYRILLEELVAENPIIINFIKYCNEIEASKRKTKITYLTQDKYILALPDVEARVLLDKFTENYDNKKFDNELLKESIEIRRLQEKALKEDEELEHSLQSKIVELRAKRKKMMEKLSEPVLDEDGDLIDEPGA